MRLFIFNSNVFIIISTCFTLLIGYSLFLSTGFKTDTFQNVELDNSVRISRYWELDKVEKVLVGSSIAAKIKDEMLPSDVYNLSLKGKSTLDCIEIVCRKNNLPNEIYIEFNLIERTLNIDEIDEVLNNTGKGISTIIPAFKYENQLINVILSILKRIVNTRYITFLRNEKGDPNIIKMMLSKYDLDDISNEHLISINIDLLKERIDYLEENGVIIHFVEFPEHESVLNSNQHKFKKNEMLTVFPESKYDWFWVENPSEYETADGIHMVYNSSEKFSKKLFY